MATPQTEKQRAAVKANTSSTSGPKAQYLIGYNLVSAGLWVAVLSKVIKTSIAHGRPESLYADVGTFARWTQTLALLEIAHSLLGVVRAPVFTTALQVASRVVLIWGIVETFPVSQSTAYSTMLFAWSVTEVVRYSYFVLALTGQVPAFLIWLRYNLFFVLYPLGIGSEVTLVVKSIPAAFKKSQALGYLLWVIVGIYVPGSYVLYTHMMAQRRRVLRGKQRAA